MQNWFHSLSLKRAADFIKINVALQIASQLRNDTFHPYLDAFVTRSLRAIHIQIHYFKAFFSCIQMTYISKMAKIDHKDSENGPEIG